MLPRKGGLCCTAAVGLKVCDRLPKTLRIGYPTPDPLEWRFHKLFCRDLRAGPPFFRRSRSRDRKARVQVLHPLDADLREALRSTRVAPRLQLASAVLERALVWS